MDGLNEILDAACPELVVLTARSSLPETMFVSPEVYDVFARMRARELDAKISLDGTRTVIAAGSCAAHARIPFRVLATPQGCPDKSGHDRASALSSEVDRRLLLSKTSRTNMLSGISDLPSKASYGTDQKDHPPYRACARYRE
jgi:hypothetical protein